MDVNGFLTLLSRYPLSSFCFSHYIRWLGNDPIIDVKDNDLISVLERADTECLKQLEALLKRARGIVALTESEFRNAFGFSKDLLTPDPDKVHDILAEPVIVVSLPENGFEKIESFPDS